MTLQLRSVSNGTPADHATLNDSFAKSRYAGDITLKPNTFCWYSASPPGLAEFSVNGEQSGKSMTIKGFRHNASGNYCFYAPRPAPPTMQRAPNDDAPVQVPTERDIAMAYVRKNPFGRGATIQLLAETLTVEPHAEHYSFRAQGLRFENFGTAGEGTEVIIQGIYDPRTKAVL